MGKYIGDLNMTKKLIFIISLSLALTACGNSAESTPTKTAESQNTKTTEQPVAEVATPTATETAETVSEQPSETNTQQQIDKQHRFAEFINYVTPSLTYEQGTMDQKSYDFIVKNYALFPAKNESKVVKLVDKTVTTKHLNKSLNSYLDKFIKITGDVVQIEEIEPDFGLIAVVHIIDENSNSIMGIYPAKSGDIFEGDFVSLIGVPIANYSFENVSGGYTNATFMALSSLTKEE